MHSSHLRRFFFAGLLAIVLLSLLTLPELVRAAHNIVSTAWTTPAVHSGLVRNTTPSVTAASATRSSFIAPQQYIPETLTLDGRREGSINVTYPFTATFNPITTTQRVTLTWQATEQASATTTNTLTDVVVLTWETPGSKVVTVTAVSEPLRITETHTVFISAPPQAMQVTGPSVGATGRSYEFAASVEPANTTTPITYTWQASGQPTPHTHVTDTVDQVRSMVSFTWEVTGTETITVTAANRAGVVTATHEIDIRTPPQDITISAPITGTIKTLYDVSATTTPVTTTTPLHYTWRTAPRSTVTSQQVVTSTNGLSDTIRFAWDKRGVQLITVTATNESTVITDTRAIIITSGPPTATTVLVTPQGGEELVSHDGRVRIVFAEGSIKEPAIFIHTQISNTVPQTLPAGLIMLYSFEIEAYTVTGTGLPVICCDPAAAATIQYTDGDVSDMTLRLLAWNGSTWVDLPSVVNTVEQRISFDLEQTTMFALAGQAPSLVFLPLIGG